MCIQTVIPTSKLLLADLENQPRNINVKVTIHDLNVHMCTTITRKIKTLNTGTCYDPRFKFLTHTIELLLNNLNIWCCWQQR